MTAASVRDQPKRSFKRSAAIAIPNRIEVSRSEAIGALGGRQIGGALTCCFNCVRFGAGARGDRPTPTAGAPLPRECGRMGFSGTTAAAWARAYGCDRRVAACQQLVGPRAKFIVIRELDGMGGVGRAARAKLAE